MSARCGGPCEMVSPAYPGEGPNTEIGSHSVIRHAYENVLNACARLASFATGGPTRTDGPITHQQEILAADDLVTFAIHARRLIENTSSKKRFKQIALEPASKQQAIIVQPIGIIDVIDTLVHHREIKIIISLVHLALERNMSLEEFCRKYEHLVKDGGNKYFSPFVFVKSDRNKNISFDIVELVETFQVNILNPIIELCEDQRLYLDLD
jgi:hypothetical protein